MLFLEDESQKKEDRSGILFPSYICKAEHSASLSPNPVQLQGNSQIEREAYIEKQKTVATYIKHAMYNMVKAGMKTIRAPYHFEQVIHVALK